MVALHDAAVQAGQFAIQGLTVHLAEGQFHVLLGPTGSGKTLLLETIAGLHPLTGGTLHVHGQPATDLPPEARRLSYLPQDNALFPHLDVRGNIAFGLQFTQNSHSPQQVRDQVSAIADTLGIGHLLDRRIGKLSGGERQRVALARALVLDNTLLLLDEPTSSLHESMQEDFFLLLKDLAERFRLTVILATHHRDSAFLLADTLHFIWPGALVLSTTPGTLFAQPLPAVVAQYMGIDNLLELSHQGGAQWYSAVLDTVFVFPELSGRVGAPVRVGVNPIDVRVAKSDATATGVDNHFEMRVVRILFKFNDVLVILAHPRTGHRLKMQLGIHQHRKMDIRMDGLVTCKIRGVSLRLIKGE